MSNPAPETITLRLRAWVLVAFAITTFVVAWLLGLVLGLGLVYPIATALGGTTGYAWAQRARLSPTGLGIARNWAVWDDIVVSKRRWGTALATRPGVGRRRRVSVLLPAHLSDWPSHPVIEQVRTWAPHLDLPPPSDH